MLDKEKKELKRQLYAGPDNGIGARIKKERELANMSLQALSEKSGVSKSSLQRYEKNANGMKTSSIKSVADIFKVTPSYIMGWEGKEISWDYVKSILTPIEELGYKIDYLGEKDTYILKNIKTSEYVVLTTEEIKMLKSETLSYLKFKLAELCFDKESFTKDGDAK